MIEFLEEKLGASARAVKGNDPNISPPEWKRFLDVYARLLINPLDSIYIPQILRLALFERLLYDNPEIYDRCFPLQASEITIKLIGDLARYYAIATGAPSEFAKRIEYLITPITDFNKTDNEKAISRVTNQLQAVSEDKIDTIDNRQSTSTTGVDNLSSVGSPETEQPQTDIQELLAGDSTTSNDSPEDNKEPLLQSEANRG
jgi:hypothetical protein